MPKRHAVQVKIHNPGLVDHEVIVQTEPEIVRLRHAGLRTETESWQGPSHPTVHHEIIVDTTN